MNQRKNTKSVLTWFNNIADKNQYSFIAFGVVDFYLSISIELLDAALDFASNYDNITDEDREIINTSQNIVFTQFGKLLG
jgi:hypothetical protein